MKISSKEEMYSLQRRSVLGNYLPSYTWDEFLEMKPKGNFGFRHRRKVGSSLFRRGMSEKQVAEYVRTLIKAGEISMEDVLISLDTSLVDSKRVLQGEVTRGLSFGLTLVYSRLFSTFTCREEMRQPDLTVLHGLRAYATLKTFLDAESYEWMMQLCDDYPDAVVEFTTFSCPVGAFGWNTIFWEIRDY